MLTTLCSSVCLNGDSVHVYQCSRNQILICRKNRMVPFKTTVANPCLAELFPSIFHSFEAGIAHAISSFK